MKQYPNTLSCRSKRVTIAAVFILTSFIATFSGSAAVPDSVSEVKNIIVMIPDGCSLPVVSLARWYQRYLNPEHKHLSVDPYLCGTVLTYSSNAPIGDSAPTTSCYMTGMPSQTGFIATYPPTDGSGDLVPVDPKRAYSPMATLLEAGKINLGKRSGLVFTCEFPHATPADCSAHSYSRKRYDWIVPQMVYQNVDVVIGGGADLLPPDLQDVLRLRGYDVLQNDLRGLRQSKSDKLWALFGQRDMPYDLDRDTTRIPSLAEATAVAIETLNRSPRGFFLMVEGSKIDWAAHANDPVGIATEFLAFDKACRVALDFARKDGHTAVLIVPDHGNSGISIGKASFKNYDKRSLRDLVEPLSRIRLTADGLANVLKQTRPEALDSLFSAVCGFVPDQEERERIFQAADYELSPVPAERRKVDRSSLYSGSLSGILAQIYTDRSSIGFTTHGHTGEDVFLAAYHPKGTRPVGMVINTDLADYLARLWGMRAPYEALTQSVFAPHTEVFAPNSFYIKKGKKNEPPHLLVTISGKQAEILPFRDYILVNGKHRMLNSVVVYVDKTNTFYLPRNLPEIIKSKP